MKIMHYAWRRRPCGMRRAGTGVASLALAVAASGLAAAGTVVVTAGPASAGMPPLVTTGGQHSCALMPDLTVWCWGQNITGQLGNGSTTDSLVPVKVSGLPQATDVAAGEYHTCAVDTTSRVWCWGSNAYGELGNGTTSQDSTVPVQVQGGLLASQVSGGHEFTCAVTLAHTVDCWGDNNYGELGNGTTTDSSKPVKVKGLTNVTQVAAGYYHACAVESNGTLWCWGDNGNGELGNGTTTGSDVPVIAGLQGATQVAAGLSDTCAIGNGAGDVLCWGWNDVGQLGDGTTTDRHSPTQAYGLTSGVQQLSLGMDSSCAIADSPGAAAVCWGDNNHGKLGTGVHLSTDPFPSLVFGLLAGPPGGPAGGPRQIAAGGQHACVVLTTGLVRCWGYGFYGQLGNGSGLDRPIPTQVIGLPGGTGSVSAVAEGSWTGCAVTLSLNADCWGQAVGDGTSIGTTHTGATPVKGLPANGVSQVTTAYGGCALVRTGGLGTSLRCWGDNTWGELGDGTTTDRTKPVTVQQLPAHVQSVASGATHNCAIVHNAGAYCWGANDDGQLGNGTTTNSSTPVPVTGLPLNLAQVAAADDHTCALLGDQTVRCWGLNSKGQLGNGSTSNSSTPVAVTGLTGALAIAAGDGFSCAMTNAGGVECWGLNNMGQLGNGSTSDSSTPVAVTGLTGVVAIAAGDDSACATLFSGQVDCWGDNSTGELGSGSVGGMSTTPVTVTGAFTANGSVSQDMGASTCALNTSEQAFCWGDNTFGELGDGTSGAATDSGTPVAVQGL